MKYFISHHQQKGIGIENALNKEGWIFRKKEVDIALFDHSINMLAPNKCRNLIKEYYGEGATIIIYPHGTTGSWWMDSNLYNSDKMVFANLVIGEGHKYVESIRQPNLEHYVIGWNYCPIKDFQKSLSTKRILFAPIHASESGQKLREECRNTNSRVFEELLKLGKEYTIIVRHLDDLGIIGLKYTSKAIFVKGKPDNSFKEIDESDLVIAEGTFMYLAVARGKPTIGINQHVPIRPNEMLETEFKLNNWDKYGSYMAYPIDFDDGPFIELIGLATNKEQSKWKQLFIGKTMNQKHLSNLLINLRKKDLLNQTNNL